jgi:SAM-dependent methyltransferase
MATAESLAHRILRAPVPVRYRPVVRVWEHRLTWRLYAGDTVACPCCEGSFRGFRQYAHELQCPRCGSLGRHRLLWLYLTRETTIVDRPTRVLHVAPEFALQRRLTRLPSVTYVSGDLTSALAGMRLDVCELPFADASFDLVLCSHVLEHVVDDRRAIAEIARVLDPGGTAIVLVPIGDRASTIDGRESVEDAVGRRVRYGHVRSYGRDYVDRLAAAGLEVDARGYARELEPRLLRRYGIEPGERLYVCSPASAVVAHRQAVAAAPLP